MLDTTKLVPVETETPVFDRRKSPRLVPHQGDLPVTLTTDDGRRFETRLQDISAGGIRLAGHLPVNPPEQVKLGVTLSKDLAPYEVAAQVVHSNGQFTGLCYVI